LECHDRSSGDEGSTNAPSGSDKQRYRRAEIDRSSNIFSAYGYPACPDEMPSSRAQTIERGGRPFDQKAKSQTEAMTLGWTI